MDIQKMLNEVCEFKEEEPYFEKAALTIAKGVWAGIDFEGMQQRRMYKIYDEFSSKMQSASYCNEIDEFINNFARKMGVLSIPQSHLKEIIEVRDYLKEKKLQNEFLEYVAQKNVIIVALFRLDKELKEDEKL